MGVKGLFTFVENHPQIYRDVRLRGRRLVIDGSNLLHLLYCDSGLDENHGGDYATFELLIEKFITSLRACGVKAYVLLDGGTDPTGKKFETKLRKAAEQIKKTHRAAVEDRKMGNLPQLAKIVFRQTLARLEVAIAQCYGEADQEIAALANELQCPVLSNDSDFFIFNLQEGFLPLSHFQWQAVKQGYIPCKNYNISSFCIFFNIQCQVLPTFAALAGNDYVNLNRIESAIKWTQLPPAGSGTMGRLKWLVCWVRGFHQPQEALEAALGLMGELSPTTKEDLVKGLNLGMKEYRLPPSSLKKFFINGIVPPAEEKVPGPVPDWIRRPLLQARVTANFLDVLLLHQMRIRFPVDSADMPNANLTSRPLRQVMYGLLLGRGRPCQVQEGDRDGLRLKFTPVQPTFREVTKELLLSSLDKAEPSQCLQVLLESLGVTEASLNQLPPQLRLPVAATCYWLQRAQPSPDKELLEALLLGLSYGDALRCREALQIQYQPCEHMLDLGVAHAFNQWQACLKDSIYLNQLLGFPLPEPQVARLYEGTLVHHLVHCLRTGQLKSDHSQGNQYETMLGVVHRFHTHKASTSGIPKRAKPLDDLPVNLQRLSLLYEDDTEAEVCGAVGALEDPYLDHLVSVRSRYSAKREREKETLQQRGTGPQRGAQRPAALLKPRTSVPDADGADFIGHMHVNRTSD